MTKLTVTNYCSLSFSFNSIPQWCTELAGPLHLDILFATLGVAKKEANVYSMPTWVMYVCLCVSGNDDCCCTIHVSHLVSHPSKVSANLL